MTKVVNTRYAKFTMGIALALCCQAASAGVYQQGTVVRMRMGDCLPVHHGFMVAMGGADKVLLEQQAVPSEQEHLADQAPGRTMVDAQSLKKSAPLLRLVSNSYPWPTSSIFASTRTSLPCASTMPGERASSISRR